MERKKGGGVGSSIVETQVDKIRGRRDNAADETVAHNLRTAANDLMLHTRRRGKTTTTTKGGFTLF